MFRTWVSKLSYYCFMSDDKSLQSSMIEFKMQEVRFYFLACEWKWELVFKETLGELHLSWTGSKFAPNASFLSLKLFTNSMIYFTLPEISLSCFFLFLYRINFLFDPLFLHMIFFLNLSSSSCSCLLSYLASLLT